MLKIDYNNMMSHAIGAQGFSDEVLDSALPALAQAHQAVTSQIGKGWQQWCDLPNRPKSQIDQITDFADQIRKKCNDFVILGIGGSALGPLAVATALLHLRHNDLPASRRKAPKLFVEDNIDPERMQALLEVIDLDHAYFNVITKSGETSETLSQFLIIYNELKKHLGREKARERIIVTTTIGKGTLYNLATREGFKVFGVGEGVGGRFSVLDNVGLVPLAVLGIDIAQLLQGAADMTKRCTQTADTSNPALITAFLKVEAFRQGKNISVMMPYADSLRYMSDFYCQLWGESLGKATDLSGKTVNVGQTPVKSLGVTDQHSQLQLYTEGPFDKVTTFLAVDSFRVERTITDDPSIDGLNFLKGHTLNELINAERVATTFALTKAHRQSMTITLEAVTAYSVGQLLTLFMYQTAYAGALLAVDTFNQPGVEETKKATFAMLGRAGFESKLAEIKASPKSPKYTV